MFTNSQYTKVECVDFPSSYGPCHGISLVLSNGNMKTILSENSSNEHIVECFDTSEVTNINHFLLGSNINTNLSSWDLLSITSMQVMFYQATKFNNDTSGWDISSFCSMNSMFNEARIFNNDVSRWDVSYVYSMDQMINNAETFEQKMCERNLEGKEVGILCLRTVNAQYLNVLTVPPSYY